jgi:hypothetical protein
MRGHRDLRWCVIAAVVCALVAALFPLQVVRLLAALPLTLFLPGYAIVAVAFGRSELAPPKRLMLSVAVSLMVLPLGALVLNVFPFGIRTWSWAVLLVLIVLAASRGAALRRGPASGERRPAWTPPRLRLTWKVAPLVAALLIATAAVVLAQEPLPAKHADGYTALWMLPANADEEALVVGVQSNEQDPASYRLRIATGGGSQSKTYRVKLDPGEEKTFEVKVPSRSTGKTHVVASLYREGNPGRLFRRVTRWLPRQQTFP